MPGNYNLHRFTNAIKYQHYKLNKSCFLVSESPENMFSSVCLNL